MATYASIVSVRRLAPVILTSIIISAVISFIASTLLGTYETAVGLAGDGGGDVLIIYGASSRAPHTSIIPLSIYDKLREVKGVKAVSPEVVAAALTGDRLVIVRGVDPDMLSEFQDYSIRIVDGVALSPDASHSTLAGERLAKLLNLKVGDRLILRSIFSDNFLEVRIDGIFESGSTLDYELLAPLHVAQWLRGLPRDAVSLIRVKIDSGVVSREDLILYLRGEREVERRPSPLSESTLMRLLSVPRARRYAVECAVEDPEESMKSFLERVLGVNEAVLWGILSAVAAGSMLLLYLSPCLTVLSHSREIRILRYIGASKKRLAIWTLCSMGLLAMAAGVAGFFLGFLLSRICSESFFTIMGVYAIEPAFDLRALTMTIAIVVGVTLIGALMELSSVLKDGEGV